ncbi:MAG: AAA family ATPase [Gammaproteobacteria bacterium]|nr:AAA family ATPase [Gammaproteobacteria bacterium]
MAAFYEVVAQVMALLRKEKRVSYRALRRQFQLDDDYLDDLKFELVRVKEVARDKDGEMLVWTGDNVTPAGAASPGRPVSSPSTADQINAAAAGGAAAVVTQAPGLGDAAPIVDTKQCAPVDAERRQLTVMFCDLVDSTSISGRLDPEDFREIVRAYQMACAEVIRSFDGHIAQYLRDGILVYFGYPRAHEDDALRAVLTGLGIVQAMHVFNGRLEMERGLRLATRVGIHTGPAVVGEIGSGVNERLALGVTPNVAARIEAAAEPDTVVVSADTYRLTQGTVECEELGSRPLKGVAEPVPLYRVLDRGERRSGPAGLPTKNPPRLIGREPELARLLALWQQVAQGEGQAVMLSGDPGIGKSHLVRALERQLGQEGHRTQTFRCSAYHQHSAMHPVMEGLHRQFRIARDDSAEAKLRELEDGVRGHAGQADGLLPLLASLLSVWLPEGSYAALSLSFHRRKDKTLDALVDWLLKDTQQRPTLLVFEDLHWADHSSLELLDRLLTKVPATRVMVLITHRREYHRQVAKALVERFPDLVETQPELPAHHYTEAGMTQEAIGYWQWAGERAMRRSAHVEAIAHLTTGLPLLKALPETPKRLRRELQLQTALGPALIAMKGYGAEDVERSYGRARHPCQLVGEAPELASVLVGLEAFYLLRAELPTARNLAEQLLALAERQQDQQTLMVAHAGLGVVLFYRGEFEAALGHLEEGISLYDPRRHRMLGFQDPGVACLSWAAIAHWLLGDSDRVVSRSRESLGLARELEHPFSLAFALNWMARVHQCRRETEAAKRWAQQAIALSSEQGFPFLTAHGLMMHGWCLAQEGRTDEGMSEMRSGLKLWRATGAALGGTYLMALVAEVYAKAGRTGRGLAVLRKAFYLAGHTGEEWWLAELHRLRGELLMNAGRPGEEARSAFADAVDVARRQGALLPERLAAEGLARLSHNGTRQAPKE